MSAKKSIAQQYAEGEFDYDSVLENGLIDEKISKDDFKRIGQDFHRHYDDWYRGYYARYEGKKTPGIDAIKALVTCLTETRSEAFGHMHQTYMNCGISSNQHAYMYAVEHNGGKGHHTVEKLGNVISPQKLVNDVIIQNAHRSLSRLRRVEELYPETMLIGPASFEGMTRVLQQEGGTKLTFRSAFQSADFMSYWNPQIDACRGFVLDDPEIDIAHIDVDKEITLAQEYSRLIRPKTNIISNDWANSRNSISESARGIYTAFGKNPLRLDAQMDMRLYEEQSHSLRPATLLEVALPIAQHIARWTPQGIEADTACLTMLRFFHLHRMRTNAGYNQKLDVPLRLDEISDLYRNPSQNECEGFSRLEDALLPMILEECAHMVHNPNGLPKEWQKELAKAPLSQEDIGVKSITWQRQNIDRKKAVDIWALTRDLQANFERKPVFEPRTPKSGAIKARTRRHDFDDGPFDDTDKQNQQEIWPDRPFEELDQNAQDVVRMVMGVLETGAPPADSPQWQGYFTDLKRGKAGAEEAAKVDVQDLSLLPGVLGEKFKDKVVKINLQNANDNLKRLKQAQFEDGTDVPVCALGSQQLKMMTDAFSARRDVFGGEGLDLNSQTRLAVSMEMLRRNYVSVSFEDNWEKSEDLCRLMVMATKIEFGCVERPGENNTQLRVLDERGDPISLNDRYQKMRVCLEDMLERPNVDEHLKNGDTEALEKVGAHQISLALARVVEIYDSLSDPAFSRGRFEIDKLEYPKDVLEGMQEIGISRDDTIDQLEQKWIWLWSREELDDLRQDYDTAWRDIHGRQADNAGPEPTDDFGIQSHDI